MDNSVETTVAQERGIVVPTQRTAPPAAALRSCRCGHERDSHEHFRAGTDCATCDCTRFRRH